jgi:hypothetical protein
VGLLEVSGGDLNRYMCTDLGKNAMIRIPTKIQVFLRLVSKGIELDRLLQMFEV